jgi:hypothetical protein
MSSSEASSVVPIAKTAAEGSFSLKEAEDEGRSRLARRDGVVAVVISAVSRRALAAEEEDEELFLFLVLRRGPVEGVAMAVEEEGGREEGVAIADMDEGPPAAGLGAELAIVRQGYGNCNAIWKRYRTNTAVRN